VTTLIWMLHLSFIEFTKILAQSLHNFLHYRMSMWASCKLNNVMSSLGSVQEWSPYKFQFEALSYFNSSIKGLIQIQDVNLRIYIEMKDKTHIKLVHEFYMIHVSSTMWRIKNQPSNSTSWSDNTLRLLVLVAGILYWGLQVTSSFSIWGCILKGCFERGIFRRAKPRLKGIEALIQVSFWRVLKIVALQLKVGSNLRRQSKNIKMR
jgi:hypothetical protein